MLDEPSLGLAPLVVREVFHVIAELRAAGVSILLVEQNARAALQVADYGYVLETGETVLEGTGGGARRQPARRRDLPRPGGPHGGVSHPTVVHMLAAAAAARPHGEALVCGERRVSYARVLRLR